MADELSVRLTATDQLTPALRSATRATESMTHALDTSQKSMVQMGVAAGAAGVAFNAMANAAQSALSAIGNAAIGLNSKLEQANIAFTTMLGSGEKAAVFLKDLQAFAATTPFEFPQLVEASKRMLAFGFAAEQVKPLLTAVGNAAAAMGSGAEGINRMTTALGQMQAKGKVTAEEMMQLTESGIPAWQMLADVLGTDVAGAMAAVEKRTVDAATFIEAFQTGVAARFGDMMAAQAKTLQGAWSTVTDSLQMAVANGFKPLFDVLSELMQAAATFLQSATFEQWAQDVATAMGAAVRAAQAWVSDVGPKLTSTLDAIGGAFLKLAEPLTRLDALWTQAAADFAGFLGQMSTATTDSGTVITDALSVLGDAFDRFIVGPLNAAADFYEAAWARMRQEVEIAYQQIRPYLDDLGQYLGSVLPPILDTLGQAWQVVWQAIQDIGAAAWEVVRPVFEGLGNWLGETGPQAVEFFRDTWAGFWDNVGPLATAAWANLQPLLEGLGQWLGDNIPRALAVARQAWDQFWETVRPILEAIGRLIGQTFDFIGTKVNEGTRELTTAWEAAAPRVQQSAQVMAAAVETAAESMSESATEVATETTTMATATERAGTQAVAAAPKLVQFATAATTTTTAVQQASEATATYADTLGGLVAQRVTELLRTVGQDLPLAMQAQIQQIKATEGEWAALVHVWEQAGRETNNLVDAIYDTSQGARRAAQEVGKAILEGVAEGIEGGGGMRRATGALNASLDSLVQAGRQHIRAQSPSLLFAEEVGKPIPEGIAAGIERGTPLVVNAFGHLQTAMDSGMQRLQSGAQTALSVLNRGFAQPLSSQHWGDLLGRPSGDAYGDAYRRLAGQSFQQLMQMAPPDVATQFQIENPTLFLGGMRETPTQDDVADLARRIMDAQRVMPQGGGGTRGGLAEMLGMGGGGAQAAGITRNTGRVVTGQYQAGTGGARRTVTDFFMNYEQPGSMAEAQLLAGIQKEMEDNAKSWEAAAFAAARLTTAVQSTIDIQNIYSGHLQKASVAINDWSAMLPLGGGGAMSRAQAQGQTLGSRVWQERFQQAVFDVEQMGLPFGVDVGKQVSKQLAKSYPEYAQQIEDMAYLEIPALQRAHDEATGYLNSMSDAYRQGLASADAVAEAQARVASAADALAAAQASAARRVATPAAATPAAAAAAGATAARAATYVTTTGGAANPWTPGEIPSYQHGGIMRGTGLAMLHGPEAIIPLGGTGTSPYNSWSPSQRFMLPGDGGGYSSPPAPVVQVQVEYNPTFGASTAQERQQAALDIVKYIIPELRRRGF